MRKAWKCHYSQLRAQKINSNNPKAIGLKLVELYVNNYKLKKRNTNKSKFHTGTYEWPGKTFLWFTKRVGECVFLRPTMAGS